MAKRRVKSLKNELLKKAREAMLAAVQIYNNPHITFKTEAFITFAVIGWTYLLHAYFRGIHVDYRYFSMKGKKKIYDKTKHGAFKHWELERCLDAAKCPLDSDTKLNIKFLIGIRHEIEHQMTNKIDEYLSAKLQACALNFDYYISSLFDKKYCLNKELALSIQFSPLSPEQQGVLRNNPHVTSNIQNFVVEFEADLTDEELKSSRYAYRVLFFPINAKRQGQADQVIEFITSGSPLAEDIERTYAVIKETEKSKYLPSQIVEQMKKRGFMKFSISNHTELWKSRDAKNLKYGYGVQIAKTWYWYDTWLTEVGIYCEDNKNKFMD